MRRTSLPRTGAVLLVLFALAACGGADDASTLPTRAAAGAFVEPWDTLAPDSIYGASPVENLRVVPVDLDLLGIPARWEGMRVAVLSDFQIGLWRENAAVATAAVSAAVAAAPDLIVLLGDFVAAGGDPTALSAVLAPLRGHAAVAVLGDADIRTDTLAAQIVEMLRDGGVRVLRNSSVPWIFDGDTAMISGADPKLVTDPAADQEWILSQLGGAAQPGLLLTHQPQLADRAPRGRFPGILAGNTFCGRIEVPGAPRLSWLAATALPGAAVAGHPRFFRFGDSVMFVTCGTGYGFVPIRFGAPPEVALLTLHPILQAGAGAADSAGVRADSLAMDTLLRRFETNPPAASDSSR